MFLLKNIASQLAKTVGLFLGRVNDHTIKDSSLDVCIRSRKRVVVNKDSLKQVVCFFFRWGGEGMDLKERLIVLEGFQKRCVESLNEKYILIMKASGECRGLRSRSESLAGD